jgi:hypothetical protein
VPGSRAGSAPTTSAVGPAIALCLLGAIAACAAPPPAATPVPVVIESERPHYDPRYEAAFAALQAAVAAHDDELAQRILDRLLARGPDAATREHAQVYQRILRGRKLAGALDLRLVASCLTAQPSRVQLELIGSHSLYVPLEWVSGPGSLRILSTGVDEQGSELRVSRALPLPAVARWHLPAGSTVALDLGVYDVPSGAALGLLAEWDVNLQPGTIRMEGVDYPASLVQVRGCESLRLAAWLPGAPVPADSLARYVAGGGRAMSAMVERAVRVDLARHEAALDALVPEALKLSRPELPLLVPALRWLSGRRDLGADIDAWQAWLVERAARPAADSGARPALDLPETAPVPGAILPARAPGQGDASRP